jgi:3-oxoacyl-[acyl-carrier-protein] synthase-3
VGKALGLPERKVLSNLQELGNTGCGSALLVYAQNSDKFRPDDKICLSVFGGGYSAGTCLLQVL